MARVDADGDAPMAGHVFAGMQTREHDGHTDYRASCTCGHTEVWAHDKDTAWAEAWLHWLPVVNHIQSRRGHDDT